MDIAAAQGVIDRLEKEPSLDEAVVADALLIMTEYFFENRKGVSTSGVAGAPHWLGYEMALWRLGETIRAWLKVRRDLKGNNSAIFVAIEKIILDCRFGKGRQSLVVIMGDYAGQYFGKSVASLIGDPELTGHAIKAVTKLGVAGLRDEVHEVLEVTKIGWVKAAARKYLEKNF